jgi:hypothetical protein
MTSNLTEKEFSKHLNTKFKVAIEQPIELELTQVKSYVPRGNEQTGMERFSAFFVGPLEIPLGQASYPMEHEGMGSFDLFLVPISRDDKGSRYEAVFNYFKERAVEQG